MLDSEKATTAFGEGLRTAGMGTANERVAATYPTYPEAQRAVDLLVDRHFPVERVAIVGRDLRFVEQVTGRLSLGRAALQGASSGALAGAALGFFFGLFDLVRPLASGFALAFWGVVVGAVAGALVGLVGHSLTGGRRDFSSIAGMQAGRYDVVAPVDLADDAARLLRELPPGSGV